MNQGYLRRKHRHIPGGEMSFTEGVGRRGVLGLLFTYQNEKSWREVGFMSRPGREPVRRKPERTNKRHDVSHGLRKIMDYL